MVAANCWRYSSNKTIDISFQKINIVICLLILLLGIHGYCFYSNLMYSSLSGQKKVAAFLAADNSRGSDPYSLSNRGSAPIAARSRFARLPLVAGIVESALHFKGICRKCLLLFLLRIYSRGSDPYSLSNRGSAPIAAVALCAAPVGRGNCRNRLRF